LAGKGRSADPILAAVTDEADSPAGSDRTVMKSRTSGPISMVLTWSAAGIMSAAAVVLIGLTILGQH